MSVPHGFIRERLIADALEVIVEGVEPDLSRALTFFDWRNKGGYHVIGATKQDFLVRCATKEYGGMIAREVSVLLNQALEHRLLLSEALRSGKTPSNSWLLVTTYYWCLFLALAWLRMVGKVVTYLPTDEISCLKNLYAKDNIKCPQNGTFVVTVTDLVGAKSDLKYRRLKTSNFHEGLWNTFYKDLDERIHAALKEPANLEIRLYSALSFRSQLDDYGWLSKLRNIVNYRVGFAYEGVNGKFSPNMMPILVFAKSRDILELVKKLEIIQEETNGRSVAERPNQFGEVMLLFGVMMTHLLEDVCSEVWSVRGIDSVWAGRQDAYSQKFGEKINSLWPL
jgi:hypothetical protein